MIYSILILKNILSFDLLAIPLFSPWNLSQVYVSPSLSCNPLSDNNLLAEDSDDTDESPRLQPLDSYNGRSMTLHISQDFPQHSSQ